jgi:hypothetical protein
VITREASRRGRRSLRLSVPVVLGAALIGVLALPASAPAASIDCFGKVKIDKEIGGFDYEFFCTEKVTAFTIMSTKPVEYFGTEVNVFQGPVGAEAATNQRFACEGGIPDRGFGCYVASGQQPASPFYTLQGEFSNTQPKPCSVPRNERFKTFLVVATELFSSSGKVQPTPTISEPIRLNGPKCPKGAGRAAKKGPKKS